jgi:sugar O-acyltransferase (sialic acid O-acetyltransferase NeuD family)
MFIFGASGHAKVVLDIARASGATVDGFIESEVGAPEFAGLPVITEAEALRRGAGELIIAIGNPQTRKSTMERFTQQGWRLKSVVHPRAVVASGAQLGAGTVVMAGAVINPGAHIGEGVIVNTNASIDHDCELRDYVQICPGASLGGAVRIGEGTWIGVNACVIQGLSVGDWTMVGAGAAVVEDLPDEVVAYGVPAKIQRRERYFPVESAPASAATATAKNSVQDTVADVINTILRDSGRDVRVFVSADQLMGNIGLDSLDLAVMTVSLEQRIGLDPFRSGRGAVRSFGELVAVYEESLRDAAK